jgi:primosomal protein N' (replication factor Y)
MCHYSGYARRADTQCEQCGSSELLILGSGTQKIEEELSEWFPEAKVLRFDKDSTSRKGAHERILTAFANHEADILIGTQLVAKGLDFPNVTTVGVVDADTEQAFPSFQSTERLFQLLSQVSGRSGRGQKPGKVIIQTRQSSNVAIQCARTHDHKTFARQEMKFRKELNYPPFSRLIRFVFKGQKEHLVIQSAGKMHELLSKLLPQVEQLGPSPGAIGWVNKNYIWELTLKLDTDKGANYIEGVLSKIMDVYARESAKGTSSVRVNINVDAMR